MANLDERYVLSPPLELYFVNKDTGLPLANGEVTFWRDSARNVPKAVYELTGNPPDYTYTALPNPMDLSAVGTAQNAGGDNVVIYFYPYDDDGNLDLYYVVVRDEFGVEQFTREAWPNITAANDPTGTPIGLSNQIANPQFSQVFINTTAATNNTVYTVSAATRQVCALAPDWDLVLSGTGSVTVSRVAIAGNTNVPTSPPYALDISVGSGITFCGLRQRLNVNTGLWASTHTNQGGTDISLPVWLSGSLTANTQGAPNAGVILKYVPSTVANPVDGITILAAAIQDADFQYFTGGTEDPIPESNDAQTGANGYVDIYAIIDNGAHVQITSIQVLPTNSSQGSANIVPYDLQSTNRETAYMGDYYIPNLGVRPAPTLLSGWDFPLNPTQFSVSGTIPAAAAADYIWDQTIAVDLPGTATYTRAGTTGGLQVTTVTNAAQSFYLLQYLSGAEAKKALGTKLSVNVFAYRTEAGSPVTMRVYLYRGSTASGTIPVLPTTIGTVATTGVFTLTASNWTEIPRTSLNTPETLLSVVNTASISSINNGTNDYGFTGWELVDNAQIADTDKIAVVVTFAYTSNLNVITVNSISLTPGAVPARPAPKSFEQSLQDCQLYYQKSFEPQTIPATFVAAGAWQEYATNRAGSEASIPAVFVKYLAPLRAVPTVVIYSPSNASNQIYNSGSGAWSASAATSSDRMGFVATGTTPGGGTATFSINALNWTADARLGKV